MNRRNFLAIFLFAALSLFVALSCAAQQPTTSAKPQATSAADAEASSAAESGFDLQALIKETEQVDMRQKKIGIFWWVPPDYWNVVLKQQGYTNAQVIKAFEPFKKYNLFMVAVGEQNMDAATFATEVEIKKNIALRDQHGNGYKPLPETPEEIGTILGYMRPVLKKMLGNFGEGMQFVIFPAKDMNGNIFADAHTNAQIFLDVTDLMGPPTSTYTWKFPLTALSPPKFCPVGKEKVEANWQFCPWHGNKLLNDPSAQPATASGNGNNAAKSN